MFNQCTKLHASNLIFLFPYGGYAAAAVSASIIEKELLFFYLLSQFHSSLLIQSLLDSIALCFELLLPSCVASTVLYISFVSGDAHPDILLPVCPV